MSTYNPVGHWDWYEVGGRWADKVPNNMCLVKNLKSYFTEYFPAIFVADGIWYTTDDYDTEHITEDELLKVVEKYADKLCFIVDFHS
jgi:hypothetical protein